MTLQLTLACLTDDDKKSNFCAINFVQIAPEAAFLMHRLDTKVKSSGKCAKTQEAARSGHYYCKIIKQIKNDTRFYANILHSKQQQIHNDFVLMSAWNLTGWGLNMAAQNRLPLSKCF